MNRIILIGNGFDLAHGLPTSYNDFIKDYSNKWRQRLIASGKQCEEDTLCKFSIKAISATALSLLSSIIVGISVNPANLDALKRRSPAIIW